MRAQPSAWSAQSRSSTDQPAKALHRAELVERLVKNLSLVHLAGADEQADVLPGKFFQLLRQVPPSVSVTACGRGGAVVAEKIAILQPDDLAAAEEGQGLQRFAQFGQGLQRSPLLATAASMISWSMPPSSSDPLLIDLPGALFDGEFVIAADERDGEADLAAEAFQSYFRLRCRFR